MCSRSASARVTAASGRRLGPARRGGLQVAEGDLERRARGEDDRPLDDVLQLADVARPGVADQGLHDRGRDGLDPPAHPPGELLGEVADQPRDVVRPLPQRRQHEREDVQPVVEVLAEAAVGDHPRQVAVRGRHQPHVHLDRLRAAEALELLLLQHAEQLGLQLQRDVADLVEEQRPLVGQLEAADLLADGAGEGALLVAEQLALQQPRGDGRAVELDEGAVPPGLSSCRARAMSSLPVPVSPRMSTVEPVGATVSTCFSTRRRAALSPTISPKLCSVRTSSSR